MKAFPRVASGFALLSRSLPMRRAVIEYLNGLNSGCEGVHSSHISKARRMIETSTLNRMW